MTDEERVTMMPLLAKLLPSIQDVDYSARHLGLSVADVIDGLHEGYLVFRYVRYGWRVVYLEAN